MKGTNSGELVPFIFVEAIPLPSLNFKCPAQFSSGLTLRNNAANVNSMMLGISEASLIVAINWSTNS
jgi:hypothetical protein